MYPVAKCEQIEWRSVNSEWQDIMLTETIQHPLAIAYPPSVSYIKSFLKHIISCLEVAEIDVIDRLYEIYTALIGRSDDSDSDPFCFKTYLPRPDVPIILKESKHIVSNGTTGLCTWQASQYFAEWAALHPEVFCKRH
jgi:hypothetical protein